MSEMVQWPNNAEDIKIYLCDLWRREYSDQGCLPFCYVWELKRVPLSHIIYGKPMYRLSQKKIDGYIKKLRSGLRIPPLVCLNYELLDGYHRYQAYRKVGLFTDSIDIYINKK